MALRSSQIYPHLISSTDKSAKFSKVFVTDTIFVTHETVFSISANTADVLSLNGGDNLFTGDEFQKTLLYGRNGYLFLSSDNAYMYSTYKTIFLDTTPDKHSTFTTDEILNLSGAYHFCVLDSSYLHDTRIEHLEVVETGEASIRGDIVLGSSTGGTDGQRSGLHIEADVLAESDNVEISTGNLLVSGPAATTEIAGTIRIGTSKQDSTDFLIESNFTLEEPGPRLHVHSELPLFYRGLLAPGHPDYNSEIGGNILLGGTDWATVRINGKTIQIDNTEEFRILPSVNRVYLSAERIVIGPEVTTLSEGVYDSNYSDSSNLGLHVTDRTVFYGMVSFRDDVSFGDTVVFQHVRTEGNLDVHGPVSFEDNVVSNGDVVFHGQVVFDDTNVPYYENSVLIKGNARVEGSLDIAGTVITRGNTLFASTATYDAGIAVDNGTFEVNEDVSTATMRARNIIFGHKDRSRLENKDFPAESYLSNFEVHTESSKFFTDLTIMENASLIVYGNTILGAPETDDEEENNISPHVSPKTVHVLGPIIMEDYVNVENRLYVFDEIHGYKDTQIDGQLFVSNISNEKHTHGIHMNGPVHFFNSVVIDDFLTLNGDLNMNNSNNETVFSAHHQSGNLFTKGTLTVANHTLLQNGLEVTNSFVIATNIEDNSETTTKTLLELNSNLDHFQVTTESFRFFGNSFQIISNDSLDSQKQLLSVDDAMISLFRNVQMENSLVVSGNSDFSNITVFGSANVSGNAAIDGNINIDGIATITGNADIEGDTRITGNTEVFGTLTVHNNIALKHPESGVPTIQFETTSGNIVSEGSLSVNDVSFLNNDVSIKGNLIIEDKSGLTTLFSIVKDGNDQTVALKGNVSFSDSDSFSVANSNGTTAFMLDNTGFRTNGNAEIYNVESFVVKDPQNHDMVNLTYDKTAVFDQRTFTLDSSVRFIANGSAEFNGNLYVDADRFFIRDGAENILTAKTEINGETLVTVNTAFHLTENAPAIFNSTLTLNDDVQLNSITNFENVVNIQSSASLNVLGPLDVSGEVTVFRGNSVIFENSSGDALAHFDIEHDKITLNKEISVTGSLNCSNNFTISNGETDIFQVVIDQVHGDSVNVNATLETLGLIVAGNSELQNTTFTGITQFEEETVFMSSLKLQGITEIIGPLTSKANVTFFNQSNNTLFDILTTDVEYPDGKLTFAGSSHFQRQIRMGYDTSNDLYNVLIQENGDIESKSSLSINSTGRFAFDSANTTYNIVFQANGDIQSKSSISINATGNFAFDSSMNTYNVVIESNGLLQAKNNVNVLGHLHIGTDSTKSDLYHYGDYKHTGEIHRVGSSILQGNVIVGQENNSSDVEVFGTFTSNGTNLSSVKIENGNVTATKNIQSQSLVVTENVEIGADLTVQGNINFSSSGVIRPPTTVLNGNPTAFVNFQEQVSQNNSFTTGTFEDVRWNHVNLINNAYRHKNYTITLRASVDNSLQSGDHMDISQLIYDSRTNNDRQICYTEFAIFPDSQLTMPAILLVHEYGDQETRHQSKAWHVFAVPGIGDHLTVNKGIQFVENTIMPIVADIETNKDSAKIDIDSIYIDMNYLYGLRGNAVTAVDNLVNSINTAKDLLEQNNLDDASNEIDTSVTLADDAESRINQFVTGAQPLVSNARLGNITSHVDNAKGYYEDIESTNVSESIEKFDAAIDQFEKAIQDINYVFSDSSSSEEYENFNQSQFQRKYENVMYVINKINDIIENDIEVHRINIINHSDLTADYMINEGNNLIQDTNTLATAATEINTIIRELEGVTNTDSSNELVNQIESFSSTTAIIEDFRNFIQTTKYSNLGTGNIQQSFENIETEGENLETFRTHDFRNTTYPERLVKTRSLDLSYTKFRVFKMVLYDIYFCGLLREDIIASASDLTEDYTHDNDDNNIVDNYFQQECLFVVMEQASTSRDGIQKLNGQTEKEQLMTSHLENNEFEQATGYTDSVLLT